LRDRLKVYESWTSYSSRTVGSAFYVHFDGLNEDPGQFLIIPDEDDPLTGVDLKLIGETKENYN
jgi:hypothetical protein